MLNSYARQDIAQIICNNKCVIGFNNIDEYMNWLKLYTNNSYIIDELETTQYNMGYITAIFIMKCKDESKVISFTKRIILYLKNLDRLNRDDDDDYYGYDEEINDLINLIHPLKFGIFPVKNLKYINKQVKNDSVHNEINDLFDDFRKVSTFDHDVNENRKKEIYKHIIQHSELLVLKTFNFILNQHGDDISESVKNREEKVYKILHLQESGKKLNNISNIKERNNKKSHRGITKVLCGVNMIENDFLKQMKITNGISKITSGLIELRSTTSDAHTQTISPTKEETIFSVNISSSLVRFLIYRFKEIQ